MKKRFLIIGGVALVALLVSGVMVGAALAEGPSTDKGGIQQTFIGKLAGILGIQEQKLKDAVKQAQTEMTDDATAAGRLTQEQANRLKKRIEQGGIGGPPNFRTPQDRPNVPVLEHLFEVKALAEYLGIKPAELIAALNQGKTLAQIGEEHGKSRADLKQAILSYVQKRLEQAVSNGKLTKKQAANTLQKAEEQVDKLLDRSFKVRPAQKHPGLAYLNELKVAADFLGMKPAELFAELQKGKTLAQIGEEHGKTRADLKQAALSGLQKRLDQAVANGKLTTEQAANMLQKAGDQVDKLLDRSFKGLNFRLQVKPRLGAGKS